MPVRLIPNYFQTLALIEPPEMLNKDNKVAFYGDNGWTRLVPQIYKALANPLATTCFPRWENMELFDSCAYWEAANYLIHMLLGWTDPAKGLHWLLQTSAKPDDDRVKLLLDVWNSEGQLDLLLAWYGSGYREYGHFQTAHQSIQHPPNRPIEKYALPQAWWRTFNASWERRYSDASPFQKGSHNNLHLNFHSIPQAYDGAGESHLFSDLKARKAVLVLDCLTGWYQQLKNTEPQLPPLAHSRSWHVDVFVQPLGWLGTYRRSRETGLWFLGKHSLHMRGN